MPKSKRSNSSQRASAGTGTVHRTHTAKIANDPLKGLPIGTSISIDLIDFSWTGGKSIPESVANWGYFEGALIGIGVTDGKVSRILGNATCIAPGLAVTATHVVGSSLEEITNGSLGIFCIGIRNEYADHWVVSNITYSPLGDIAYLSIELRSEIKPGWAFKRVGLRIKPPEIGEELTILGFRFLDPVVRTTDGGFENAFGGELLAARGRVSHFFPDKRDAILMPYPCFQIECGAPSGVSGGAILDDHGLLVGVLSRSFETVSNDGPAMAAWLPWTLNLEMKIPWPPDVYRQPVNLLEIDQRVLWIDDRDRIKQSPEGYVISIE